MKIPVLFVQSDGCYSNDDRVDPWPIERNAMLYRGNLPVVCHPPCQLWGKMARVNYARWGGDHNKPGNDGGCFAFALDTVNRCGGVIEHPAFSYAWDEFGLKKPKSIGWVKSGCGWVCEVWQSAYGHRATKRTWLYFVSSSGFKPSDLIWKREKGTHQIGFYDKRGKSRNKPTLGKREANATPFAFKEALLMLAMEAASGKQ